MSAFGIGVLAVLSLGFGVLHAPLPIPLTTGALAGMAAWVRRHDLLRLLARGRGTDGPGLGPADGPPEPPPSGPDGGGGDAVQVDWERFTAQFWAHVERERSRHSVEV